jgi:carbon-monoxide dehydrogenase large subunit
VSLTGARTCKVPTAPYRGAGGRRHYLIETALDQAARELGCDPVELRRRNLVREFPYATPLGWTYDSGDYERCLDYGGEDGATRARRSSDVLVGTGVALCVERSGGLWERASISLSGGRLRAARGLDARGQGTTPCSPKIRGRQARSCRWPAIDVLTGDSAPARAASARSRAYDGDGRSAVAQAAAEMIEQARALASERLVARAEFRDGRFFTADKACCGELGELSASVRFASEQVFSSGAYAAVVAVERATGA